MQTLARFFLAIAFLLALTALASVYVTKGELWWQPLTYTFLIGLPAVTALVTGASFFLPLRYQLNLVFIFIGLLFGLYGAEALFHFIPHPFRTLSGRDGRTHLEVVREKRQEEPSAVPSVNPTLFLGTPLSLPTGDTLPLAGVSNSPTVFCNETGQWVSYQSDRFGFRNRDRLWDQPKLDMLVLGDSYTHGFCMPDGDLFADRLREHYPKLINLGINGNGPLLILATLREYGHLLKAKRLLWFTYEGNDFEDLSQRLDHPILSKYLKDSFSQKLSPQQPEIDLALSDVIEAVFSDEVALGTLGSAAQHTSGIGTFLKLWYLRRLIGLYDLTRDWPLHRLSPNLSTSKVLKALRRTLTLVQKESDKLGAQFSIVYLPAHRNFSHDTEHPFRQEMLRLFESLGITVIDLLPIFKEHEDPLSLYTQRRDGHFTEEGNELVAATVVKALR